MPQLHDFVVRSRAVCASVRARLTHDPASILVLVILLTAIPVLASGIPERRELATTLRHGPGNINHPVGVIPSSAIEVPEGWPLDVNGSITCITCHTSLPKLDGSGEISLRGQSAYDSSALSFCAKCHSSNMNGGAAGMHWMAMGAAHIRNDLDSAGQVSGAMDADSRRCLGCHDGVSAIDQTDGSRGGGHSGVMGHGGEHPIGVGYSAHSAKTGRSGLKPVLLVSQQIRLPGGRVSCVSCHNLYSGHKHLLAVPIDDSALCFSCHKMD